MTASPSNSAANASSNTSPPSPAARESARPPAPDERKLDARELARLERELVKASPAALALLTGAGKWNMARHLDYLDRQLLLAIDEAAAGRLEGLVISMPPQHGKSELVSKFLPAWYLGTFPNRRVILTGYEADFAAQWGRRARDLVERFGHLFGVRVSKRSAATHRWDLDGADGGMTTAGVGGPITGKGAHLLIVDYPIKNDAEARSALHRQKLWDWWQSTASTRLRPGGLCLVVQTRWHRDDLAGRILREAKTNKQRWREIRLPAIAEHLDPLGRAPGEALWPEVYSLEHLERVRAGQTNYYWRSLYQQDPIAEGSTEWPQSFFGPDIWFTEWPKECWFRAMALDPSKGRSARFGDYSAFVLMHVTPERMLFIDADLAIRNVADIVDRAIELGHAFAPDGFAVETNQFQELLADELIRAAEKRHLRLDLYRIDNRVPKIVRIRSLTRYLAGGRLRFKADSPGARLLVRQLEDFPNADHDDGPDALEMVVRVGTMMIASGRADGKQFEVMEATRYRGAR